MTFTPRRIAGIAAAALGAGLLAAVGTVLAHGQGQDAAGSAVLLRPIDDTTALGSEAVTTAMTTWVGSEDFGRDATIDATLMARTYIDTDPATATIVAHVEADSPDAALTDARTWEKYLTTQAPEGVRAIPYGDVYSEAPHDASPALDSLTIPIAAAVIGGTSTGILLRTRDRRAKNSWHCVRR